MNRNVFLMLAALVAITACATTQEGKVQPEQPASQPATDKLKPKKQQIPKPAPKKVNNPHRPWIKIQCTRDAVYVDVSYETGKWGGDYLKGFMGHVKLKTMLSVTMKYSVGRSGKGGSKTESFLLDKMQQRFVFDRNLAAEAKEVPGWKIYWITFEAKVTGTAILQKFPHYPTSSDLIWEISGHGKFHKHSGTDILVDCIGGQVYKTCTVEEIQQAAKEKRQPVGCDKPSNSQRSRLHSPLYRQ
ncbi:MAG: hypothetical protein HQ530_05265 [Parcubacteria group bacterium]|nr:hypothetical protein [Parcubacteria group bacterium]